MGKLVLVAALGSLGSCFPFDENSQTTLTGPYFLDTTPDGANRLYCMERDGSTTEPLLTGISNYAVAKGYLAISHAGQYYLFLAATSAEAARRTCIGPLTAHAFRPKLYQLTGDSTLRLGAVI